MLHVFGRKPTVSERCRALVEKLAAERQTGYSYDIKDSALGRELLVASPEEQRALVLAAAEWLNRRDPPGYDPATWPPRSLMQALLLRKLPFEHDDVIALLDWSIRQQINQWRATAQMVRVVDHYLAEHALTPALQDSIKRLVAAVQCGYCTDAEHRRMARLRELADPSDVSLPLIPGEAWSDAAARDIESMGGAQQAAWTALLKGCLEARGSKPAAKWSKQAQSLLEPIGLGAFKQAVLRWFPLVDEPRTRPIRSWQAWEPDPNLLIEPANAAILRALVWLCATAEDEEIARALMALAVSAYRKVPGRGPRCARVGNACVWSLGNMPGTVGVAQLALLRLRVKVSSAQKVIDAALRTAAERTGLPPEEIEELCVPDYGLQEVGIRRENLGDYTAELAVAGTSKTELRWFRPDGKGQRSTPKAVKAEHAEALKEISQAAKDVRKMLPAQRDRIERLYLAQRKWPLRTWRERYLDHPLVGTLARRLIWKFSAGDRAASGIWHEGRIVGRDGEPLDWLSDSTGVELWHPIQVNTEVVLGWREWLAGQGIQQPFKQAHREIYLLTDAERETRLYSNRFAAHIIKQHQFNALCTARGWANRLRLLVDDEYPPATRPLAAWGLRAEFWVEGIGDDYGTDTTAAGTYLYLTTDQVRFYAIDAPEHRAHAGGGGYYSQRHGRDGPAAPLPLEQIPPLVFSEVMRDVDLFVGVASVANDPNWYDGGPQGRHQDYWASYSFGDLSETARMRKEVLEGLVPRLKIADRCRVTGRFLVVRGDLRTYKIHLGSANILMEPNDQYLCIVRAPGTAESAASKVFLPFEGDNTLSVILSKAFLLAADKSIKDPTILRQIRK